MVNKQSIKLAEFQKTYPDIDNNLKLSYGTAGYRARSCVLNTVFYRVGIAAALRSKLNILNLTNSPKNTLSSIGIMITASHNPKEDNGVKIVNPMGEMLESEWESVVTKLVDSKNSDLNENINQILTKYQLDKTLTSFIIVGRDNRSSGPSLLKDLINGIHIIDNVKIVDIREITTPMLHYVVKYSNVHQHTLNSYQWSDISCEVHCNVYFNNWMECYKNFIEKCKCGGKYSQKLLVDVAHGVGGIVLDKIHSTFDKYLPFRIINNSDNSLLNYHCGSDYVKLNNCFPETTGEDKTSLLEKCRIASFDGDADRIVYSFLSDEQKNVVVFDGDDMCCLFAYFIIDLLNRSNIAFKNNSKDYISIGIVHTAYTNGGVIKFLKSFKDVVVKCVPTGVKHLHKEANKFDIGIYYESNGHGTILYNYDKIFEKLNWPRNEFLISQFPYDYYFHHRECDNLFKENTYSNNYIDYVEILKAFLKLSNQAVGDSFTNLLMVEAVTRFYNIDLYTFTKKYSKLVTKLSSAKVNDKFSFVTHPNDEQKLINPINLQKYLDDIMSTNKEFQLRTFVRPSGTEDIVRIYVEATSQEVVDQTFDAIKFHISNQKY